MSTTTHDHCIKICNSLLRGELSAVETYDQAINKYTDTKASDELLRIRTEHAESVTLLTENVRSMGGEPDHSSGAWGLFATAVQGTADLFGKESALESLKKGEAFGRQSYLDALLDNEVMPECKTLIRDELLPPVNDHLAALERLLPAA